MALLRDVFRNRILCIGLGVLCLACLHAGCDRPTNNVSPATADESNRVVAVSYPLQFLTQRIVGASMHQGKPIEVEFPVPSNADPRKWRPDRDVIQRMQSSDLVVANGIGAQYASWLDTVSIPESRLCNSATKGLAIREYVQVDDIRLVHSHGPEGEHSHPMMISQSWLDPAIAKKLR